MKESDVDDWGEFIMLLLKDRVSKSGDFPHRLSGTLFSMQAKSVTAICDLAKRSIRIESENGKKIDAMVADKLRRMADSLEETG